MAVAGSPTPWSATWQLNPGVSPAAVGVTAPTTPASEQNTALSQKEDGWPATRNGESMQGGDRSIVGSQKQDIWQATRTGGKVEGEDRRIIVECVEKMQGRDAERAQEAASLCRKGLEGDENGERLKALADMSVEWTELFRAWEVHHGAGNHKVCQQLLLLVADVLRHPYGTSAYLKQLPKGDPSRDVAADVPPRVDGLARNIVRKRMKQIYGHLTSGQRGRANAALMLLTAINGRGKSLSGELVGTFDFSLSTLAKLAAPPKQTGKGEREAGRNPEKRSTRATFTEFALSFLLVGDPLTTRSALQKRSLFTPVLHNLYGDSAEQIARVLEAIQRHVLPDSAGVPARLQGAFLGDIALEQLINIAAFEDSSENGDVTLTRPASLAHDVLTRVLSDPAHGVCPAATSSSSGRKNKDAAAHARLLRALLKLKATEVARHSALLVAATEAQPTAAAAYLAAFPFSLEPRPSDRWFAAMTLLRKLVTFAARGETPTAQDAMPVKTLLTRIVPPALPRAVLSRALQHRSASIKFVSLAVLSSILVALHTAQKLLKRSGAPILNELADQARLLLPDPQILLALNTAIEKGDVGRVGAKEKGSKEGLGDSLREGSKEGLEEGLEQDEGEEGVSTEELRLKLLEVLAGYQRTLPDALAACRFNPYKLLPENPATLPRGEQAALLEILAAASEAAGADSGRNPLPGGPPSHLLPLLRQMLGVATGDLRAKAECLARQSLTATGVFSDDLEVTTWLDLLPRWDALVEARASFSVSDAVAAFLADAASAVSKNPYRFLERVQAALSAHTLLEVPKEVSEARGKQRTKAHGSPAAPETRNLDPGGSFGPEFGPLVVCALGNCLKVLGAGQSEGDKKEPTSKPGGLGLVKKTGIANYVAGTVKRLLRLQRNPTGLAVVVCDVLAELGEEDGFRCEVAPLLSLRTAARSVLSPPSDSPTPPPNPAETSAAAAALDTAVDVFATADPSDRPAAARALGYAILTSPRSVVGQKLPELTSAFLTLTSASGEVRSAEESLRVGLLRDLVMADPGLLSAAVQSLPESFRRALKKIPKRRDPSKVTSAGLAETRKGSDPAQLFASFLESLPFAAVLSAVCDGSHQTSSDSNLAVYSAGVKTLLSDLLAPLQINQRATAVRLLLYHVDSLLASSQEPETLVPCMDTLIDLLQVAVFAPRQDPATPQGENPPRVLIDLAVDALRHPALSARFLHQHDVKNGSSLRQHDVTNATGIPPAVDARIARFVLALLDSAQYGSGAVRDAEGLEGLGAGLDGGSAASLERACSHYVERAVWAVEKGLTDSASVEGLEAAIQLAPFGDPPSLLRLFDRLLPPPSIPFQNPQTQRARLAPTSRNPQPRKLPETQPAVMEAPALRRLTLQLAGRVLSEASSKPLLTSEDDGPGAVMTSSNPSVGGVGYEEVYQRVAGLAAVVKDDEADACLLTAWKNAERTMRVAAHRTVGIVSERRNETSGAFAADASASEPSDEHRFKVHPTTPVPTGYQAASEPSGLTSGLPFGLASGARQSGLVSLNHLASLTPVTVTRAYVHKPTRTRAELLRLLVRHSAAHQAEFGESLSPILGDKSAGEKACLVSPTAEYLRVETEMTTKGSESLGDERKEEVGEPVAGTKGLGVTDGTEREGAAAGREASSAALVVARSYLDLVTQFLVDPSSALADGGLEGGLTIPGGLGAGKEQKISLATTGLNTGAEAGPDEVLSTKKRKARGNGITKHSPGEAEMDGNGGGKESSTITPSKKRRKRADSNVIDADTEPGFEKSGHGGGVEVSAVLENAVELFRYASALVPLTEKQRTSMLRKLLPKGGWNVRGSGPPNAERTGDVSTAEDDVSGGGVTRERKRTGAQNRLEAVRRLQQAALARLLILNQGGGSVQDGGSENENGAEVGGVDQKRLLRYCQTMMTSLAGLHRAQGETERVKVRFESALLGLLAEAAGYLSGLTDKFGAAVASFVESVLRWRFGDSVSLTIARSLLTAVKGSAQSGAEARSENGLRETGADDVAPMEEGEEITETNGLFSGDQSPTEDSKRVAAIGSRLFDLAVSHSQFVPTLLASKAGGSPLTQNLNPLPEAMGKHSGDFVPSSLGSILALLDTPPPPIGLVPQTQGGLPNPDPKTAFVFGGVADAEASVSATIAELLTNPPEKEDSVKGADSHQPITPSKSKAPTEGFQTKTRLALVELLTTLLTLRNLHGVTSSQSAGDLLSLLLAAYGATMSNLDRRILHLMRQIDGQEGAGGGLAGMDYLWGERAMHARREQHVSGVPADVSARARQFREESPLDPRRCGLAVLYFPVRRPIRPPESDEGGRNKSVVADAEADLRCAAYEPSFLLPFAVHVLKTSAMEARDFARSGLLQVALAALAAADEGMRRAGYNVLALYMANLEDPTTSFREKQQIRLLLHYVRNAITQPLQRIPMTSAVFAAEACCIQMHPEHQLFAAINKFLLKRPALDLEDIPMFYNLFNSGSPSYRTERVWMLRLLAAGLVTSADGRVFRRRFALELLMSFAGSAMADAFTRRLVMQVLRHAVRIHKCASDLVDHAGLVPWLANLVVAPRLGAATSDANDPPIVAGMALEVLEVLLAAARDDWSRDGAYDDFLAAVKLIHWKLAVTVDKTLTVPFLRLAAGLAEWNGRRKRSAGPVFSTRELSTLLEHVTSTGSLDAVRWALQLLLHCPCPSILPSATPGFWHVVEWSVMAALVLQTSALSAFTSETGSREFPGDRVLKWLSKPLESAEDIEVRTRLESFAAPLMSHAL